MNPRMRLSKNRIDLYGGSAWWVLPDKMVDYLLEAARNFTRGNKFYPLTGVGGAGGELLPNLTDELFF